VTDDTKSKIEGMWNKQDCLDIQPLKQSETDKNLEGSPTDRLVLTWSI
jgi:hypothetical protein